MGEFKGRAQGFHGPITATVELVTEKLLKSQVSMSQMHILVI